MTLRVALVIFPGFQMLDLAALSVFEIANLEMNHRGHLEPYYQFDIVSSEGGSITTSAGVKIDSQPIGQQPFDTVMVGGSTDIPSPHPELINAIRGIADKTRRVASICTGAFILAEAGLLDGHSATTHWGQSAELQKRFPHIRVDQDKIFIHEGKIWTSAGMTACIDLALAMVKEDLGADIVKSVARKLVVYHRRIGGQSQFSTMSELDPDSDRVRKALDFAKQNLCESLSVEQLAEHVHWSPRHFSRAFQHQTGLSPAKAVEKLRIEAAKSMIEAGHSSIAQIALQTGFGDEERMRRAFLRSLGQPPQALMREIRSRQPVKSPQGPDASSRL